MWRGIRTEVPRPRSSSTWIDSSATELARDLHRADEQVEDLLAIGRIAERERGVRRIERCGFPAHVLIILR